MPPNRGSADQWGYGCRRAVVELQDAEAAVGLRAPHLVLCCWMPLGADWSAAFRAQGSVREYLLVRGLKD